MRVYLPATSVDLRALQAGGEIGAAPVTAFAVTPGLREWYADSDGETDIDELEYAAALQAARASIRLIDGDPSAARRRVVVSADIPDAAISVQDELERGAVQVAEPISRSLVAAIHVDDVAAEAVVRAAAAVVIEADLGLESAQDALDDAEGYELDWYAPQELEQLIDGLS